MKVGAVVLDCGDADGLADFYVKLTGGTKVSEHEWVYITCDGEDGIPLVFQQIEGYRRPVWPEQPGKQQQMMHLDFYVDNVEESVAFALTCGARLAREQFNKDWRVLLDPAGHPFCILPNKPPEDYEA